LGFPNVGKSTILSKVTSATPKIANYHFTTIDPNLGVVKTEYGDSFVLADIPGIIEGASEGVGLGIKFLRHVERTRLLLHVIDVAGLEGRNPVEDFNKINEELRKYSEKLAERKQIIVANKIDSMQDDTGFKELEKMAKKQNIEIFKISAATGEGLNELFNYVSKVLKTLPKEELYELEDRVIYTLEDEEDEFTIDVVDGEFIVTGPACERLMGRVNIGDNESYHYMEKMLKKLGIEQALREKGVKEGDTVKILEWVFEWYE
jgi:GTP-binding protein